LFFQKNFWENRYLVLLISAGVALIATLTVNFSTRNRFHTKTDILWNIPLHTFYVQDSLLKDSLKTPLIKDYDYYNDHSAAEFFKNEKDTINKQIPLTALFYTKDDNVFIGYFKKSDRQGYMKLKDIYIAESEADSIAYYCKKRLVYDVKSNNWITGFSLPRIQTIYVFYLPPKEFATIPDSLINKPPF
jgi:hypothetical protein